MQIIRPARGDLHLVDGPPRALASPRIGGVEPRRLPRSPTSGGRCSAGGAAADGGGGNQLILWPSPVKISDLEEGKIGIAAIGISLQGGARPGGRLGRMSDRSAAMGLRAQLRRSAAEKLGLLLPR
jgi:hypothetical protein